MPKRLLVAAAAAALAALAVQRTHVAAQSGSSKLADVLAELSRSSSSSAQALSVDALPVPVQDALRAGSLRISANNEAQVYVLMNGVSDESLTSLEAAGATIEVRDLEHRRIQARVAVSRLQAIADLSLVDAVRLPSYAHRRIGQVTTEGDPILYTDAVRQQLSVDGTGVRVGVLSDGLRGVFATDCTSSCAGVSGGPMATGDLPISSGSRDAKGVLTTVIGPIIAKSFRANGDLEGLPASATACPATGIGAEGTALLEIVHDIAPGAKLSFANADTDLAFTQAVNFLAASNDVVLDAMGFYGVPYDGTSAVSKNTAAALNNDAFPIRAYFTAVGNDADRHYFGAYTDSGVDGTTIPGITSTGRLHLFQRTTDTTDALGLGVQPYNVVQLPQNGQVTIYLTWDDPFGASSNNYDLYLVQQSTGRVVASSTGIQVGRQDPVETIDFTNRGSQDTFRVVVQNVQNGAQVRRLNLFAVQPDCAAAGPAVLAAPRHERLNFNTASRSIAAQADAGGSPVSVISVGAICSASGASAGANANFPSSAPNESCLDTSNRTIEFFSSRGPTIDGRVKPDITAIDGVSVTGAGGLKPPLFGTSVAAPHVGGMAALLLQSAPCLLNRTSSTIDATAARARLRDMIVGRPFKVSSSSPDNTFGAGRADSYAAVRTALPARSGATAITVDGNSPFGATLKIDQLGFTDPNECPLTTLSWTGGCGTSPATTMTCAFGPNAVSVSATNNGYAYSSPVDLQITVTDFTFDVSPGAVAVSPGNTASYRITIAPQNGPYNSEIALSCTNGNLPPQSSCSFDPPAVTPGNKAVQSTMTISTTASSLAAAGPLDRVGMVQLKLDATNVTNAVTLVASAFRRTMPLTMVSLLLFIGTLCVGGRRAPRRMAFAAAALSAVFVVSAGFSPAPAAGVALFPTSLGFGTQTVGTTTPQQFVYLTNIGADALTIGSITASGDFSRVTSCGTTLAAGANCAVAVSFTPTVTGSRTGTLTFNDTADGSPHTVSLSGTGQAAPATSGGTPTGSYSVTVSGTASSLAHSSTVTLVVQ